MSEPLSSMSRREVMAGYGWNLLFGVVGKFFFVLIQIFLYRRLGPSEVGVFMVLIPIFQIVETVRDAGLAITYISDRNVDEQRERSYVTLGIVSAAVFALLIYLSRPALTSFFAIPELDWGLTMVALAMLINGFAMVPAGRLQKKARFRDAGIADFISSLFAAGAAVTLALLGFGFEALVWQFVVKSLLYVGICWRLEPSGIGRIDRAVLQNIWRTSTANLFNNLLYTIYTVADTLLITRLFGRVGAGYYGTSFNLAIKPLEFIVFPLGRTLFIAYTRESGNLQRLAEVLTRTITVSMLGMVPLYALVASFASPLVLVVLGSDYAPSAALLPPLAIYFGARSIGMLGGNALAAIRRPGLAVIGWFFAFGIAISLIAWRYYTAPPELRAVADSPVAWISLEETVWAIAYGSLGIYAWNTIAAFTVMPPSRPRFLNLLKGTLLAAITVTLIYLCSLLPFQPMINLAIATAAGLVFLAAGVGTIFVGSPAACITKPGIKRLWEAL